MSNLSLNNFCNDKKQRTVSIISKEYFDEIVEYVKMLKRNSNISMIEFYDKQVSRMIGLEDKYHLIVEFESNDHQKYSVFAPD